MVELRLEPYGPGDCRLLKYLPGGYPIYEDACREGSSDAWKNAAQSLCLAASLWASPPKSKDWELAGIARIEAHKYLSSGCKLMDLMLGTTNMERGKKMMSTEIIDVDKLNEDMSKSSYAVSLAEMLMGMTARDQLLDALIEKCNKFSKTFSSSSDTFRLSQEFLTVCQELRQYFKISQISKHYLDVNSADVDFFCNSKVHIDLDIYNPIKLPKNNMLQPYPISNIQGIYTTLGIVEKDKWALEFYGNLCKYIKNKYRLIATITYGGTKYVSRHVFGKINLSKILTHEIAREVHEQLVEAQSVLVDKIIFELISISSIGWEDSTFELVDMSPNSLCFHINLPQFEGEIFEFALGFVSENDHDGQLANERENSVFEAMMSTLVYKIRDMFFYEWEVYVFDSASRFADLSAHWKRSKSEKTDLLLLMVEFLVDNLTTLLEKRIK